MVKITIIAEELGIDSKLNIIKEKGNGSEINQFHSLCFIQQDTFQTIE